MTTIGNPAAHVIEQVRSYMKSQAIYVMAKLGLADLIAGGVTDAEQLARASESDPDALRRLLRVLSDLDLVAPDGDDGYRLTAAGECLRDGHPDSLRNIALLHGGERYREWADLAYSIQTGKPATERILGRPVFAYYDEHPDESGVFNRAMADLVRTVVLPSLSFVDFSRSAVVVDVGGGSGSVLRHVLREHPGLRGVLFDRPSVVDEAVPELRSGELAGRCQLVGGDFLTAVVEGGDTYLVSRVVHDFPDGPAGQLLRNIRAVVPPDGRLVVLERVLPDDDTPDPFKLMDLAMLVANGGRERTADDFARLLAGAGFRLEQIVATKPNALNVITAVPA